jgi:hypothetical protein
MKKPALHRKSLRLQAKSIAKPNDSAKPTVIDKHERPRRKQPPCVLKTTERSQLVSRAVRGGA